MDQHCLLLLYHGSKYSNLIGPIHDQYFDFFHRGNILMSSALAIASLLLSNEFCFWLDDILLGRGYATE